MKRPAPIFTNLGMHFVNVSADKVALVQVEVNVRGLLSVHARRLCKSKRGMACLSGGAVRMILATPEDREIASVVEMEAKTAAIETNLLHNELTRQRHELHRTRAERDELKAQTP